MQNTGTIPTRSGYAVMLDHEAGVDELADLETLERAATAGQLVRWPSLADEMTVHVIVDEKVPERLQRAVREQATAIVEVPSGALRLTDAATVAKPGPGDLMIRVTPGRYQATVLELEWSSEEIDAALRRRAGTVPVALRDAVGLLAFAVGVATLIGLPVFVLGRALDDGWAGAVDALTLGALVLGPLWLLVVIGVRAPWMRKVDRADAAMLAQHPDAVVVLERLLVPDRGARAVDHPAAVETKKTTPRPLSSWPASTTTTPSVANEDT